MRIQLADLGLAQHIEEGQAASGDVGTLDWMAPEVLRNELYDYKVDVWSATIAVFLLLTGQMPFQGGNIYLLLKQIERADLNKILDNLNLTHEAKSFIKLGL